MKKIFLSLCILTFLFTPISAQSNLSFLLSIQGYDAMYIIDIIDTKIIVKEIQSDAYLPSTCDFNQSDCKIETINTYFNTRLSSYIHVQLDTLLTDFDVEIEDAHTIETLKDISSQCIQQLSFTTILNYNKYIQTNLSISDIYDLYSLSKKQTTSSYYALEYITTDLYKVSLSHTFTKIE